MTAIKPRMTLAITRTYAPVPNRFLDPSDSKELFKSFGRYPLNNTHWRSEVIEYNGREYVLESINETAFDTEGRPFHEFVEDKDGIQESSTVYFEGKDGKTMFVRATSGGFVSIGTSDDNSKNSDPREMVFITKGRRNDLGYPYVEVDEAETEEWDESFYDFNDQYEILEKDPYDHPLKTLTKVNNEIIHLRTYEYTYAR